MKVGMIFECGPSGPDRKVCEHLAKRIKPDIEIESITLDNKKNLVFECGKVAAQLFTDGCDRVVITWDLHPSWRETAPCRKKDCEDIVRSLVASGVDISRVFLVCIEEELEAWLLADERAIEAVLSKAHRKIKVDRVRHPERVSNPKKYMDRLFQTKVRKRYIDLIYAEKIAEAIPDFARLKRVDSFVRFAQKVADLAL